MVGCHIKDVMKVSELLESTEAKVKKIPDGYSEGKWTWAIVIEGPYEDEVLESGFSTKREALAWLAKNKT